MKNIMNAADHQVCSFEEDVEYVLPMHIRDAGYREKADLRLAAETIADAVDDVFGGIAALRVERRFIELAFFTHPSHGELRKLGQRLLEQSEYLRQYSIPSPKKDGGFYLLVSVQPVYYDGHYAACPPSDESKCWQWGGSDE